MKTTMQTPVARNSPLSILIVDDELSLRTAIRLVLEQHGYRALECAAPDQAIDFLRCDRFDLVLCDLNMPNSGGLAFIKRIHDVVPDIAVVIMTGFGSSELAIEALRAGAYDYLSKPFAMEELVLTLKKIEEREKLRAENAELKSDVPNRYSFANFIAHSKQMKDVFQTVERLADYNTTVLITGESGTGKELLARAIHHNSPRRGKPFVAVNCGAIPENLIESELFGHKRGAFTDATRDKRGLFEEANNGTIFLDEVGELPLHLQVKLLRALQERAIRRVGDEELLPVDVRVLAATLRDLEQDVKNGRFRDDLFYRLNVVNIELPSLRERPEDIPILVEHFLKKHCKRLGLPIRKIAAEALKKLMAYSWRGNVRELENVIERAIVLSDTETISVPDLPTSIQNAVEDTGSSGAQAIDGKDLSIKRHTKALEINLIKRALEHTKGNRTRAAKELELSHRALLYKMKEYKLE